jgi:hypothetical protein
MLVVLAVWLHQPILVSIVFDQKFERDDLPSGAPDFIVEDVELDADPDVDEFFSRNLLVMLTVLNFFG